MDLLNKFNKKPAEGSGSAEPHQNDRPSANVTATPKDNDLLGKADGTGTGGTEAHSAANGSVSNAGEVENRSSGKEEPSGKTVKDPDSWTKESALSEVVKLREEAKAARVKYAEQLEKFKAEQEAKFQEQMKAIEGAKSAERELAALKEKEADKKRSLEEKLADREGKLATMEAQLESVKNQYENRLKEISTKASAYEAEMSAQEEIYKNKVKAELDKVPAKYRTIAETLAKGAGDSREALIALTEAHLNGMFEDKKVVVSHQVPGAADGARATKEKLEEADKARKAGMTPSQMVKEGLTQIRSGKPNSAFRGRNS
jgi:DNA repair exonuclease SbcCD ATPase subunit